MDFFDLYQQRQLKNHSRGLRQTAEDISDTRRHAGDQLAMAEERVDRLTLLCEAMWEVLSATTDLTMSDLAEKVSQLDQVDGVADGRRQHRATDCACGAKINARAAICQFCSLPAPQRSLFHAV